MGLPFLWTGSPTDLLWTCNLLENDSAFTKTSGQNSFMILWKDISAPRIQRASRCSRTLWPRSHVAIFRSFRILGDNGEQCLVSSIFGSCDASALLHRPWNDWGLGWVAQSVSCCIITCRFWLRVVCIPVSRNLCLEAENVQGAGCRVFLLLEEPLSSRNWGGTGVSFWEVVVVLKAEKLSRTWYAESSIFFLQLSFFSVLTFEKTSYLWVVAADPWFTRSFRVIVCWSSKCCDDGMAKKRIRRVAANIWSALMRRFKCLWLFQGGMVDMSGPHGSWNVSQTSGGLVFCLISHGGAEWRMIFFDIIFLLSVPDICGLRLFGCEVAVDILLMTFSVACFCIYKMCIVHCYRDNIEPPPAGPSAFPRKGPEGQSSSICLVLWMSLCLVQREHAASQQLTAKS